MQFDGTVAALEDKVVQRATVAVLNAIYEDDFLGCDITMVGLVSSAFSTAGWAFQ